MTIYYIDKINLPQKVQETILEIYEKYKDDNDFVKFDQMMRNGSDFLEIRRMSEAFAAEKRINSSVIHLALIVISLDHMHQQYKKIGLDNMFWDCVKDISYKLIECEKLNNVCGYEPFHFFQEFYEAKRFVFGRLQFDISEFNLDSYSFADGTIKRGHRVYNIHIPSSGKLLISEVIDSLKQAYEYFSENGDYVYFCCNSWMLYPKYKEIVFEKKSNIYSFVDLFEIIDFGTTENFDDGWRIFYTQDFSNLDNLPQNTSLRRNFVKYLKSGGTYGYGKGIIVFNKKGICNK